MARGPSDPDPPDDVVEDLVERALAEDLDHDGDVTSSAVIPPGIVGTGRFVAREPGVLAGTKVAGAIVRSVDPSLDLAWTSRDGDALEAGRCFGTVGGALRSVLKAERSVLNVLAHCSGIATLTRAYVEAVRPDAVIRDTRKTLPGLRAIEKAAVRAGGGENHRLSLSDAVLIKDNHLAALSRADSSVADAVQRARESWPGLVIEVECDTLAQVGEALRVAPDLLLLDNMSPDEVREAVTLTGGSLPVEVSGGITLETVSAYARAGADYISVGAITHSAPSVDLALDVGVASPEEA